MDPRRPLVAFVVSLLAVAGCGSSDPAPAEQAGNAAVFDRIESLTDCSEVQAEFDTASANSDRTEPGSEEHKAALAYMEAANSRLQDLGC